MNRKIFEKNIEAFRLNKDYKIIVDYIEKYNEDIKGVILDKDVNGNDILAVEENDYIYYLNSRYGEEYIYEMEKKIENMNYMGIIMMFGASNYRGVRKLVNKMTENNKMIIIEPDVRIFLKAIQNIDITDIIVDGRILIAVDKINENYFQEFMIGYTSYSNMKYIYNFYMPNYNTLYKEKYAGVLKYYKACIDNNNLSRNTLILFAEERGENTLCNYKDFRNHYSINQIKHRFAKIDKLDDIPAILVSAGPSLDKNIEDIKKAEGKAFIFAVDTALKTLLRHNIIPDIVMTIDGHKDTMLFAHSKVKDINMIVSTCSNRKNYPLFNGKRFYFSDGNEFILKMYAEKTDDILSRLETGGSVANNAFSALHMFGFKKIILVGQDLAYPNNKMHTEAAYGTGKNNDVSDKVLFEVEDINGGKVLTESNMNHYRKWFEQQIIRYPELEVIDATEGGAKIHGTRIIKLTEAIDEYCKESVNFKKIIDEIESPFSEEDKKDWINRIDNLPQKLEEMKSTVKKGIKDYERMEMLNRKGKITGKEFKDLSKRIGEISDELLMTPEMDIVSIYNQKEEYEVLGEVFDCKDNAYDDIKDIVKSGTKMMESYLKAIDKTLEVIDKLFNVKKEIIAEKIDTVNKDIYFLKDKCNEGDLSEINVVLKRLFNELSDLLVNVIACEEHNNISLSKLKEDVYGIIDVIEEFMENDKITEFGKYVEGNNILINLE